MEELVLCSAEMEESEGTVHKSGAWTDTIQSLRRATQQLYVAPNSFGNSSTVEEQVKSQGWRRKQ